MRYARYICLRVAFIDVNGFIKPRSGWRDSGNGVAYLSLDVLFLNYFFGVRIRRRYEQQIQKVFKGGLLYRTPERSYGQQSWDDYALLACACGVLGISWIPLVTMICGIVNVWHFDTDGKDKAEDFLGRFVHVWFFMGAAIGYGMQFLMFPLLWIATRFIKGDDWKVWAFHEAYRAAFGLETAEHRRVSEQMPSICAKYFGEDHCFTQLWRSGLTPFHRSET